MDFWLPERQIFVLRPTVRHWKLITCCAWNKAVRAESFFMCWPADQKKSKKFSLSIDPLPVFLRKFFYSCRGKIRWKKIKKNWRIHNITCIFFNYKLLIEKKASGFPAMKKMRLISIKNVLYVYVVNWNHWKNKEIKDEIWSGKNQKLCCSRS